MVDGLVSLFFLSSCEFQILVCDNEIVALIRESFGGSFEILLSGSELISCNICSTLGIVGSDFIGSNLGLEEARFLLDFDNLLAEFSNLSWSALVVVNQNCDLTGQVVDFNA